MPLFLVHTAALIDPLGTLLPLLFEMSLKRGPGKYLLRQCHLKTLPGPGKIRYPWDLDCQNTFSSCFGDSFDPWVLSPDACVFYSGRQLARLGRRQLLPGSELARGVRRLPSDDARARWVCVKSATTCWLPTDHGLPEGLPPTPGRGDPGKGDSAAGDPIGAEVSRRAGRQGVPPSNYCTQSRPLQPKDSVSGAGQTTGNTLRGAGAKPQERQGSENSSPSGHLPCQGE